MKIILAAMVVLLTAGSASAQTSITVRPDGDGGSGGYVGPYGRELPGVSMFSGRAVPVTPTFAEGGVPVPTRRKIENEYVYSQSALPVLDGWRATLSDGIPF